MTSKLLDANGKWIWGTNPSLIQTPEERAAYQVFQQEQQSAINPILAKLNGGGFGHLPTSEEFQSITTAGTTVNRGVTKSVGQDVVQWIDCTPRNLSDNTIKTTVPVSVDWKRGCRQYLYLTENRNIYLQNPLTRPVVYWSGRGRPRGMRPLPSWTRSPMHSTPRFTGWGA
jgi:hypothetical protein